jgi:Trypsin-co-occurring domain 2
MKVTDEGVPVEVLVSVIKESIREAGVSRKSPESDLRVGSVQLVLEVVACKMTGGRLSFQVPFIGMKMSAGAKVTKKNTHTIDITLIPPERLPGRQVRSGDIQTTLVNAIATIRNIMTSAAQGDDPWILSTGKVDISFAITRTGNISLGVDGELTDDVTHILRLGLVPGTHDSSPVFA